MGLKENLILLRKKHGYTQADVADYLGIDTTSYGRIERGERKLNSERLQLISKLYEVNLNKLFDAEDKLADKSDLDLLNYLKQDNDFLRNCLISKEKQIESLIKILEDKSLK